MKTLFLALFYILSVNAFAQTQADRIQQAYIKNDKNYELSCKYFGQSSFRLITAQEKTQRSYGKLSRKFKLESNNKIFSMVFNITTSERKEANYEFKFQNGLTISGDLKSNSSMLDNNDRRAFYLPTKKVERRFRNFANSNELYKISCKVYFATEKKLEITDSHNDLHINVHPHDKYDHKKLTIDRVENYFGNALYKSYVLLEEGNFKGNLVDLSDFLEMKEKTLVKNYYPESVVIPESVEFKVSPAGHNRYLFNAQRDVEILYTGGNHNYCMWNNTRRILMGYMRSHSQAELTLNYDASAIVVQGRGLVGLNFNTASIKEDNLLRNVFLRDKEQAKEYTKKYFDYFVNVFVTPYTGLFKSVTIENKSLYGNYSKTISGKGKRVLKITMEYSNL